MADLKNPMIIVSKGFLFLALGLMASVLLLLKAPNVWVAVLLLVAVWAFCRFYYFAFYVIENYVDSSFRYSGLLSFVQYLLSRRENGNVSS